MFSKINNKLFFVLEKKYSSVNQTVYIGTHSHSSRIPHFHSHVRSKHPQIKHTQI